MADLLQPRADVVSVICKTGGFPKEFVGIPKERRSMQMHLNQCANPIAQG